MVKDSRKYAPTRGWGFAQFDDGKPASEGCTTPVFPATLRSKRATSSSTVTHLEGRDAGHFALDTKADEIAALMREFMRA